MPQSPLCFVNYRRLDSGGHAAHLKDKLARWFDPQYFFFDTQSLDYGDDFPESIAEKIACANALLMVVGPDWLPQLQQYQAEQKTDWVKLELLQALARCAQGESLAIIPVLVGGAVLPDAALLPSELRPLVQQHGKHAISMASAGVEFDQAFQSLLRCLEQHGLPPARFRQPDGIPRPYHVMGRLPSLHFHDPLCHMQHLQQILQQHGNSAVLASALHGMGGVGKTQLALQYCHAFQDGYAGVWWLRAEDPVVLELDCLQMAKANHIPHEKGQPIAPAIRQWLATQPPWLLVYDNAEDLSALKPYLPDRGAHHVLITSRRPDWQSFVGAAACLHLHHWTPDQGLGFLLKRLPDEDPDALRKVVADLGGLPLALEQAAAYMETGHISAAEYVQLLANASEQATLLNKTEDADAQTVLKTLSLALGKLSAAAHQLLKLCAVCAPDPIPETLFQRHPDLLLSPLREISTGLDWVALITELRRYALVEREGTQKTMILHRLTQTAVRLNDLQLSSTIPALLEFLEADFPQEEEDPAQWPYCAVLVPHVRHLPQLGQIPKEKIRLQFGLTLAAANYLQEGPALYGEAKQLYLAALEWGSRVLEPENILLLATRSRLASLLLDQGDASASAKLHREVLAARKRVLGPDHEQTWQSMNNLALALRASGDLVVAKSLLQQAHEYNLRTHGPEHPNTLVSMSTLAATLWDMGELQACKHLEEQVLATRQRTQGPDHLEVLRSMNNLATTLRHVGEFDAAIALLEQAVERRKRVLGPEHPDTLTSINNLAATLSSNGDLIDAYHLHTENLAARTRVLGLEHPDTIRSMSNLGETLAELGDLVQAKLIMTQAAQLQEHLNGPDHPGTLTCLNNLALVTGNLGDKPGASQLQIRVLQSRLRVSGPEHPQTTTVAWNLFLTLRQMGEEDRPREILDNLLLWMLDRDPASLSGQQNEIRDILAQHF